MIRPNHSCVARTDKVNYIKELTHDTEIIYEVLYFLLFCDNNSLVGEAVSPKYFLSTVLEN